MRPTPLRQLDMRSLTCAYNFGCVAYTRREVGHEEKSTQELTQRDRKHCFSPCPSRESNPGPSDFNSDAVTTELRPPADLLSGVRASGEEADGNGEGEKDRAREEKTGRGRKRQGEGGNDREREETTGRGRKRQGEGGHDREREEKTGRGRTRQGEGGIIYTCLQSRKQIKTQKRLKMNALTNI